MMTRAHLTRHAIALAVVGLLVAVMPQLVDAVLVSPHAVFISHARRTGQITLVNTSPVTEEVLIELQFGYPDTDSAGNIFVRFIEDPGPEHPSAAGWLRAFPRQLRMAPGQRQVVRLLGSPPADLPDGEYWSRLIVTSRTAAPPPTPQDSVVSVGLSLELRTVISVSYRKGEVNTGVRLNDLQASVEGDSLVAWVGLEREGNAAYLGQQTIALRDSLGVEQAMWSIPVAVYYGTRRRITYPIDSMAPGDYTLHFDLNLDRTDLPRTQVLPAAPISRSMALTIPPR